MTPPFIGIFQPAMFDYGRVIVFDEGVVHYQNFKKEHCMPLHIETCPQNLACFSEWFQDLVKHVIAFESETEMKIDTHTHTHSLSLSVSLSLSILYIYIYMYNIILWET